MQRRTPTHDISLHPSPECPWHHPSQLALHHPRHLAVLSAHHHINQLQLSYCDRRKLRDQFFFDIVRSSRLSASLGEFVQSMAMTQGNHLAYHNVEPTYYNVHHYFHVLSKNESSDDNDRLGVGRRRASVDLAGRFCWCCD
jgi:hypothetical protein